MHLLKLAALSYLFFPLQLSARDIRDELQHAEEAGRKAQKLVSRDQIESWWSADGKQLVYRVNTDISNETEFVRVYTATGAKSPAFNHKSIAEALSTAADRRVEAAKIPIDFISLDEGAPMIIGAFGKSWSVSEDGLSVTPAHIAPVETNLMSLSDARRTSSSRGTAVTLTFRNDTDQSVDYFWSPEPQRKVSYGTIAPNKSATVSTYSGHLWIVEDETKRTIGALRAPNLPAIIRISQEDKIAPVSTDLSPDGKWHALIANNNVSIEPTGGGDRIALTSDGTEGIPYRTPFKWSPDSSKLIANHGKRVRVRQIQIVQSSPPDQLQPKLITLDYAKPGDEIEQPKPRLFDISSRKQIALDDSLFSNPWSISELEWIDDSSAFTFVYNQRGHQILRLVSISASNGAARAIIEEKSETFIDYSQKFFLHRIPASHELLWASERSGFNHLYLIDERTGAVKNAVTKGNWNVRKVMEVNADTRTVILQVMGVTPSNPYYSQFIRIGFDSSGFTRLTESDGDHSIEFSPDGKLLIATWSRVDQPPVRELRNSTSGKLVAVLEKADCFRLLATGWVPPERFIAKGRDGTTDIHGIIVRPRNFDPTKKYPVVEEIYAGPHGQFVPLRFSPWLYQANIAELGFIVVKIDGMGTNWRSKKFHDVAWKNLKDAGFPDRIAWMKSAASTRPWMDLSRVGIYGGSAGGQNSLSGLLHHGDFYKVGISDCGCHDNRMDKIWWNEAWLGWPVDKSYEENSNVFHAGKLQGKIMLIVGELDQNVDPASTSQVVAALTKADKDFEFVPIMNAGHGAAETSYGKRRRAQFLIDNLGSPTP